MSSRGHRVRGETTTSDAILSQPVVVEWLLAVAEGYYNTIRSWLRPARWRENLDSSSSTILDDRRTP